MSFECPQCSQDNEDNRRFCFGCGSALGCTQCGFINNSRAINIDDKLTQQKTFHCGGCGIVIANPHSLQTGLPSPTEYRSDDSTICTHIITTDTNTILGYSTELVLADLASEESASSGLRLGGPEHFDQTQLDSLFDA